MRPRVVVVDRGGLGARLFPVATKQIFAPAPKTLHGSIDGHVESHVYAHGYQQLENEVAPVGVELKKRNMNANFI